MTQDQSSNATIIFIRGIPGSGKSFVAENLVQALEGAKVTLLDPDTIDTQNPEFIELSKQLEKEGLAKAIHPFRWLRGQAIDAATTGSVTVWNQPFTNQGVFDRLIAFIRAGAQKHGVSLRVLILEVNTPKEVAYERIMERVNAGGHGPSESTFLQRVDDYTSFSSDYETIQLDGTKDIKSLISEVTDRLA